VKVRTDGNVHALIGAGIENAASRREEQESPEIKTQESRGPDADPESAASELKE